MPEAPPPSQLGPLLETNRADRTAVAEREGPRAGLVAGWRPPRSARLPLLGTDVHDLGGLGAMADHLFRRGYRGRRGWVTSPTVPDIVVASDAAFLRKEMLAVGRRARRDDIREVSGRGDRAVRDHEPDLVVVDMQMGNMGGMAVCLELRLQET